MSEKMVPSYAEIAGAVARGWCSPANAHKEMDTTLAMAITVEIVNLLAAAPPQPTNTSPWLSIESAPKSGYIIGAWKDGKWQAAEMWFDDSVDEWTHTTSDRYMNPTYWVPVPTNAERRKGQRRDPTTADSSPNTRRYVCIDRRSNAAGQITDTARSGTADAVRTSAPAAPATEKLEREIAELKAQLATAKKDERERIAKRADDLCLYHFAEVIRMLEDV